MQEHSSSSDLWAANEFVKPLLRMEEHVFNQVQIISFVCSTELLPCKYRAAAWQLLSCCLARNTALQEIQIAALQVQQHMYQS
jgi:hypothetical protein